jgi:hypothetical protein
MNSRRPIAIADTRTLKDRSSVLQFPSPGILVQAFSDFYETGDYSEVFSRYSVDVRIFNIATLYASYRRGRMERENRATVFDERIIRIVSGTTLARIGIRLYLDENSNMIISGVNSLMGWLATGGINPLYLYHKGIMSVIFDKLEERIKIHFYDRVKNCGNVTVVFDMILFCYLVHFFNDESQPGDAILSAMDQAMTAMGKVTNGTLTYYSDRSNVYSRKENVIELSDMLCDNPFGFSREQRNKKVRIPIDQLLIKDSLPDRMLSFVDFSLDLTTDVDESEGLRTMIYRFPYSLTGRADTKPVWLTIAPVFHGPKTVITSLSYMHPGPVGAVRTTKMMDWSAIRLLHVMRHIKVKTNEFIKENPNPAVPAQKVVSLLAGYGFISSGITTSSSVFKDYTTIIDEGLLGRLTPTSLLESLSSLHILDLTANDSAS